MRAPKSEPMRIRASRRHAYASLRRWRDLRSLNCTKSEAYAALGDLEEQGRAVKIDRDLYYDAAVFNKLVEAVRAHIEAKGPRWPPI